mmetsp:Transcript_24179/g.91254  ORF Transcript_24179/g.91254 Transcript_24179/m.91254 type:complete len:369 (+) Transcript_24179:1275-2381(+)
MRSAVVEPVAEGVAGVVVERVGLPLTAAAPTDGCAAPAGGGGAGSARGRPPRGRGAARGLLEPAAGAPPERVIVCGGSCNRGSGRSCASWRRRPARGRARPHLPVAVGEAEGLALVLVVHGANLGGRPGPASHGLPDGPGGGRGGGPASRRGPDHRARGTGSGATRAWVEASVVVEAGAGAHHIEGGRPAAPAAADSAGRLCSSGTAGAAAPGATSASSGEVGEVHPSHLGPGRAVGRHRRGGAGQSLAAPRVHHGEGGLGQLLEPPPVHEELVRVGGGDDSAQPVVLEKHAVGELPHDAPRRAEHGTTVVFDSLLAAQHRVGERDNMLPGNSLEAEPPHHAPFGLVLPLADIRDVAAEPHGDGMLHG